MDDIRAAIAIEQLKKLPSDLDTRTNVRRRYVEQLASVKEIVVPFAHNKEFVSNYIMPVVITKGDVAYRDSVRDKIHAAGVQTSVHYPAVLPQTEYVTDHEITLPMYAALTMDQVDYICSVLDSALR